MGPHEPVVGAHEKELSGRRDTRTDNGEFSQSRSRNAECVRILSGNSIGCRPKPAGVSLFRKALYQGPGQILNRDLLGKS